MIYARSSLITCKSRVPGGKLLSAPSTTAILKYQAVKPISEGPERGSTRWPSVCFVERHNCFAVEIKGMEKKGRLLCSLTEEKQLLSLSVYIYLY